MPARRTLSLPLLLLALLLAAAPLAGQKPGIWTQIGPYGGSVTDLVFDSAHRGVVYASTMENGVFKSTDGGTYWSPLNSGLGSFPWMTELALSPADPSTLYGSTYYLLYRNVAGRWEAVGRSVLALAADPSRAGVLWGHCFEEYIPSAICRSGDGGKTWERRYELSDSGVGNFAFDPRQPSLVYAALWHQGEQRPGILRSGDGGKTWRVAGRGLPLGRWPDYVRTSLAVAPDTGVLYASVWQAGTARTFRSADQGRTWTSMLPGGFPIAAGPGGAVFTGSGARSLDGGATWTLGAGIGATAERLAVDPFDGRRALAATGRGVIRTASARLRWNLSNQGMVATIPLALVADPAVPGVFYASVAGGGLFKATHGGADWTPVETGFRDSDGLLDLPVLALDSEGPTLYAVREQWEQGNSMLRSLDGGGTWETSVGYLWKPLVRCLATDPAAPGRVYSTRALSILCAVAKSDDRGESWECLDEGSADQIVVDPSHPENLYALGARIRASHDGGLTWGPASLHLDTGDILCLEVAPSRSDVLYAGTGSHGVRQSTDRGRTWQSANGDLTDVSAVTALAIDPRDAKRIYAAMGGAVYSSRDGGRHWKLVGTKTAATLKGPLLLDPNDPQTLYAGSERRGFYKIRLPG